MRAVRRMRGLGPGAWAAVALGALTVLLERGAALGAPDPVLRIAGYAYLALLLAAPLVLHPLAFFAGERVCVRVLGALLPALLWWCTQLWLWWQMHPLPEALWLALSPLHLVHFQLLALEIAIAEVACRALARWRGRAIRVLPRRVAVAVGATVLVLGNPIVAAATIPLFLGGYEAVFQAGRLPRPGRLPGPLPPGGAVRAREVERPPSVVFILSDDHRFDFAGFEGHPFVETPSLDRLAAEGTVFTRAFVTSSLCSPSRASFLTGTYPQRHGVLNNFTPWSDENRTFLEYLSQAGYRVAFVGKWHMPGHLPRLRGVDHFVTFTTLGGQGRYEGCPLVVDGREEPSRKRYIAEELTDRALAWIEANREGPFALVLSHKSVHGPFTPDEPERGMYAGEEVALPPGAHPWTALTGAQYVHLMPWPLRDAVRRYAAAVTSMDRQIGRVLDALDRLGIARETLVVYASDNGFLWGEHGLVDKRWAYEESIRVPFVVRLPGRAAAGARNDRLVLNVDLAPTLLDLAGLAVPARMQGRSLLPLLRGAEAPWREDFYYAYWFEPPYRVPTIRALRTRHRKYVEYEGRAPQLFDLDADPGERENLAARGPGAVLERMRGRLDRLRRQVEGP